MSRMMRFNPTHKAIIGVFSNIWLSTPTSRSTGSSDEIRHTLIPVSSFVRHRREEILGLRFPARLCGAIGRRRLPKRGERLRRGLIPVERARGRDAVDLPFSRTFTLIMLQTPPQYSWIFLIRLSTARATIIGASPLTVGFSQRQFGKESRLWIYTKKSFTWSAKKILRTFSSLIKSALNYLEAGKFRHLFAR